MLFGAPVTWLVLACAIIARPIGILRAEEADSGPAPGSALDEGGQRLGFLYDKFELTLDQGHRTEAAGPFFYDELKETQHTWAIPPLLSSTRDPATESFEFDFIYPLLTYDRFGDQYRWQFFQLLSFSGGPSQTEKVRKRFTLFPVYFQQRSSDPNENYTAIGPFYGHLKNRLFRDEIRYVMFPIFGESRKKDVVTDNYFYPIFHLRHGNRLSGWQAWPLAGHEHKEVTTKTNDFGEVALIGGHDRSFILWPFYMNDHNGIGTDNPEWLQASMPAYNFQRSPKRDATTVLWPLFSWVDDREKKYKEWQMPWPLVVLARGEGKTTTRFFPLFSRSHSPTLESDFYLWPLYKYNRLHSDPVDQERTRILFYLYSDTVLKNTETGATQRRMDLWPLFTRTREFNGNTRLQVFSVLEPILPASKSIQRDYSQVWSVWRSEKNPKAGKTSQSLLWNLYRRETAPEAKKCSLLFGLFQYESGSEGKRMRLFHIPLGKKGIAAPEKAKSPAANR